MLYQAYLDGGTGGSLLVYCRTHYINKRGVRLREHGMGHATGKNTMAVGVLFQYVMLDIYCGQWATVFLPHGTRMAFYEEEPLIQYTRCYAGAVAYLMKLKYAPSSITQVYADGPGGARKEATV